MYTLPKSVFIQFVGGHASRRGSIALCLKGMHGEPPDLDGQLVEPQPALDVQGNVAHENERLLEVHWWKYVGIILQADMKWNLMVKQLLAAARAKAAALGCYLSFAGGLTPELQLHISSAIMHGVMLYGAPVWGGGINVMGATAYDMNKLGQVWDGVLRSVLGCARYGSRTLFRAEAGWPSFTLMADKHIVTYFARVKQMGTDRDAEGKQNVRPVKALLEDTIDRQTGRWNTTAKSTPTGLRYTTAIKKFFGGKEHAALQGAIGSKTSWEDTIAGCMRRAMREETEYLVQNARGGPSNAGMVYLSARRAIDVGVPYYLKRARVMAAVYSRSNTLYRLVHLRVASHALADRVHHFGESDSPNCPCGCGVEETPAYFVFGCLKWEPQRELFYRQDAQVRGNSSASSFKESSYNIKWRLVNTWLNGYTEMSDGVFDRWLVVFLNMLAKLLAKHPKWG